MSVKFGVQKVLVLAPHTDDGELGAGGIINSLTSSEVEVRYIAFSSCEESLPNGFDSGTLSKECRRATALLGLDRSNVQIKDYRVRRFNEVRQEILEDLVEEQKGFAPDIVLIPSSFDVHQDHTVIHNEAVRAFKRSTVLGYELPWNCLEFKIGLLYGLTEEEVEKKINAIKCYESQSFRGYGDGQDLKNLAKLRGSQSGKSYAEAFEIIRWIW